MLDAIRRRHATHLQRHVPRFGTVIHLRQNMAMNIDHVEFRGRELLVDLNRFSDKHKGRANRGAGHAKLW